MILLATMLPFYLFGNLHCIGMCGPLVMMIGQHRYRYFYFLGRLISFTLAGMIAGELGAVLQVFLQAYHIPALTSFIFGGLILSVAISSLFGKVHFNFSWLTQRLAGMNQTLSLLMLRDQPLPSFLFGFFTIALPCGQTIVVFSACALAGDLFVGMLNGFAFAFLTTPSLFLAMHACKLVYQAKKHYHTVLGICSLIIALLSICRGLAEMNLIPHLTLLSETYYHLVIF